MYMVILWCVYIYHIIKQNSNSSSSSIIIYSHIIAGIATPSSAITGMIIHVYTLTLYFALIDSNELHYWVTLLNFALMNKTMHKDTSTHYHRSYIYTPNNIYYIYATIKAIT